MGDVSWVVPTGKVDINCYAAGTALHSWQAVAQGKAPAAHKGMLTAAKIMACTGAELLEKPELLERIKEDWLEKLDGDKYEYDFSACLDYPLDEYIMSFGDIISAAESGEKDRAETERDIELL